MDPATNISHRTQYRSRTIIAAVVVSAPARDGQSGSSLFNAEKNGGDEAPNQLVHPQQHFTRRQFGGESDDGRFQGRSETPGWTPAVDIEDVGKSVFQFALNGVVKRKKTVFDEVTLLVETNRPRVGAAKRWRGEIK